MKGMQCPECCGIVEVRHVRLPNFACPHCGLTLCVPGGFLVRPGIVGAGVGLLVCYVFHLSWVALLLGPLVGYFILGSVLAVPLLAIAPPKLERNFRVSRTLDL